jgi:hypothetical protein
MCNTNLVDAPGLLSSKINNCGIKVTAYKKKCKGREL